MPIYRNKFLKMEIIILKLEIYFYVCVNIQLDEIIKCSNTSV